MKGPKMPEESISPEAEFLSKVHKYTAQADELIKAYGLTYDFLDGLPGVPEESKIVTNMTIETLTALKLLVTMLVERELEVNETMEKITKDIEAKIKKN